MINMKHHQELLLYQIRWRSPGGGGLSLYTAEPAAVNWHGG